MSYDKMVSFTRSVQRAGVARKAVLVAVVLLLVVAGLPVLTALASTGTCEACGPAPLPCEPSCAAIPASMTVLVLAALGLAPVVGRRRSGLLYAWSLDPPPRAA